ncbi:MAG: hypothetical protein SVO26_01980 [Chloroflexota bacterium]|nr:hypothetical protein [Chloroflexota bacterium]
MPDKIMVAASPANLKLMPGDTAETIATLRNLGPTVDQLVLSIDGIDQGWYTLPVSSVALFPNDQDELKIIVHLPKTDEVKAGSYPFKIHINSQENPGETATTELAIEIGEMLELQMDISPMEIAGRRGTYQVKVANPSNDDIVVNLAARDAHNRLRYEFNTNTVTVKKSSQAEATLQVRLGWLAFLGGEKPFDFQVTATVQGRDHKLKEGTKTASAKLVRPSLIGGVPKIRIPWFSRSPVIDAFGAMTEDRREFTLRWTVRRAQEVSVDGEKVDDIGEKQIYPTETKKYTITARNKQKTVSQSVEVDPLPLPKVQTSERIRAALNPGELKAQAGVVPATATLQIQNLSEIVDKFVIEVHGIENSWYSRSASSVALMPQATDHVQISFSPPKKQGVRSGDYPFVVVTRSESSPQEVSTVPGQLQVIPSPEFRVEMRPFRINCRRKGTFRVALINSGVTDVNITLEATDLEEGCKFNFENRETGLVAWSTLEVPVVVKPERGFFVGENKTYDVTVTAMDRDGNPQKATCQLNHRPIFKSWKSIFKILRAIVVIAVVAVVVYFVIHWGGGWSALIGNPGQWAQDLVGGTYAPW